MYKQKVREWLFSADKKGSFAKLWEQSDKKQLLEALSVLPQEDLRQIYYKCETKKRDIKKIALYYNRMHDGGVERVISILAPGFLEAGYEVFVITEEAEHKRDYPLPAGIKRITLFEEIKKKRKFSALIDTISQNEIDAVLFSNAFAADGILCVLAAKAAGAYAILHSHGTFTVPFHYYGDIRSLENSYKSADALVVLSHTIEKYFHARGINSKCIYNPVMPSLKKDERSDLSGDILFVGRISKEKCPEKALEIMAEVSKEISGVKMRFLGGSENSSYIDELKEYAQNLGIADRVVFEGSVPDVEKYYKKAKLHLITSVMEGFAMVILESKAFGVPLCGFSLPSVTFFEQPCGIYTSDFGDVSGAAEKMIALLKDENALKQASDLARQSFEYYKNYDDIGEWTKLFESLGSDVPKKEKDMLLCSVVDCFSEGYNFRKIMEDDDQAEFYFAQNGDFNIEQCIKKDVTNKKNVSLSFTIPEKYAGKVNSFRFDPSRKAGRTIRFFEIKCHSGDECFELSPSEIKTNGVVIGDVFAFPSDDPKLMFTSSKKITGFDVRYEILGSSEAAVIVDAGMLFHQGGNSREAEVFFAKKAKEGFDPVNSAVKEYEAKGENHALEFDLGEKKDIGKIRFDISHGGGVLLSFVNVFDDEGKYIKISKVSHNGEQKGNAVYYKNDDPQMELVFSKQVKTRSITVMCKAVFDN